MQKRGVRGAVHQQSRVSHAGGEEAEQGSGWLPDQHSVAEGLLALGLAHFPFILSHKSRSLSFYLL
ncbi:Universal stress protein [Musa troglodytarum]|uniref:Universal stress protein n=1 Tax=Musa troglodytarum TaxID=320322 RepID=A0A9E7GQ70_9LILI|nr:Universal stress protein [Musa troglodytarum]